MGKSTIFSIALPDNNSLSCKRHTQKPGKKFRMPLKKGILPACNAVPPPLKLSLPCKRKMGRKIFSTTGNTVMKEESPPFPQSIHFFHTQYGSRTTHCFLQPPFHHGSKAHAPTTRATIFRKKPSTDIFLFYRKKGSKASPIGS